MASRYTADWASLDSRPIPNWFKNAKFGIFIHWGPYSVPAYRKLAPGRFDSYAEWYYASVMYDEENGGRDFHVKNYGSDFEYRDFAPMFRAELFDPFEWASLFCRSQARYVVLTSKHHDGYCLWPTDSSWKKNWNSAEVGPGRDLVGELSAAVCAAGLKMGLYYSNIEWESCRTHRRESGYFLPPSIISRYSIPEDEYIEHMNSQLRELVTRYAPSLIFADGGEWDFNSEYWKTREFLAWLYSDSPVREVIVVNDRFSKDMQGKHGDYFSSEYRDADFTGTEHPWEESRGIGESYGYNRAESLFNYATASELINELVDTVSKGGNFLLNIGPRADGTIPVIMQERLLQIGQWLAVNGQGIFSTHRSRKASGKELRFTERGKSLFAFFRAWTEDISISFHSADTVLAVHLLGSDVTVEWKASGGELIVSLPCLSAEKLPCSHTWTLRIDLA